MLSTTTPDNCKKILYDDLLSLLSSTCVIRVVLLVSYLLVSYFVMNFLRRIFSVLNLSMRWLALMRRCARRVRENLIDIAKYRKNVIETESPQDYR